MSSVVASALRPQFVSADQPDFVRTARSRIGSIDALRGLVMLLMLVDHTREFFYLHAQVSDPVDVATTSPALFFSRLAAHLCAPVFVALTGLAAWLYGAGKPKAATSAFLFKRGLFLVVLEWTLVNFAWTFSLTPQTVFLQVIWAIGLAMIALAGLIHLPRTWLLPIGIVIVLGHNLLDPVTIGAGEPGHAIWAILHDRGYIDLPFGGQARTSYPLLPWIGVIALGYAIGPWFARDVAAATRGRKLVITGIIMLASFAVLRAINDYGEPHPWMVWDSTTQTVMSFLNVTKYPPSADFLLLTLGAGALLLAAFEHLPRRASLVLTVFGGAPLFFYLLHLYLLHLLNLGGEMLWGPNHGTYFSVPGVGWLWLLAAAVAVPCWFACRWFGHAKRNSDRWWMRYL